MQLRNLICEKEMLKKKISELKNIMSYNTIDDIAQELFAYIELLQAKKININAINDKIKISIGGKEIDITTVIVLRDTAKNKTDVLTSLIVDNECKLDKIELMKQRDGIYEEYILLSNKIILNDLSVKIGE